MANVTRNTIFGVFLVTFVLFILAFSTPWWYNLVEENVYFGLWMKCVPDRYHSKLSCKSMQLDGSLNVFSVTQAMMCLALVANVTALGLFIILMCKGKNGALAIIPCACIAGGLLNLIGVAVFAARYFRIFLGWSFILACVTSVVGTLNGIAALVFVAHKRQDDNPALLLGNINA